VGVVPMRHPPSSHMPARQVRRGLASKWRPCPVKMMLATPWAPSVAPSTAIPTLACKRAVTLFALLPDMAQRWPRPWRHWTISNLCFGKTPGNLPASVIVSSREASWLPRGGVRRTILEYLGRVHVITKTKATTGLLSNGELITPTSKDARDGGQ